MIAIGKLLNKLTFNIGKNKLIRKFLSIKISTKRIFN